MALSSRQRSILKQHGQRMADTCHLGKEGVTEAFVENTLGLFARRELLKLRFADVQGAARKELGAALADALDAELVAIVGRTMLLYRANPQLEPDQRLLVSAAKH